MRRRVVSAVKNWAWSVIGTLVLALAIVAALGINRRNMIMAIPGAVSSVAALGVR
jgi:hypothetical protein